MSCVDVYKRERNLRWPECFAGKVRYDDTVLTSGEEDGWVVKLGIDFSNDVDGLCLEFL
jgi:hypothetical protein